MATLRKRATRSPEGKRPLPWIAAGAVAIALGAAALIWWPRSEPFAIEPRADQNVLLITLDTLRADALSSYGGPARTPRLDALAGQGARFTFAHAHAVVTLPSHTSILTGHYKPLENFDTFDESALPTNSDVTMVLALYIEQAERFRSNNMVYHDYKWKYLVKGAASQIQGRPPTMIGMEKK